MLKIIAATETDLHAMKGCIYYPRAVFFNYWTKDWLNSDFGRRILTEVEGKDLSGYEDVEDALLFRHRLRPDDLSMGVKNLFLCKFMDGINRCVMMGPNCYPYLMDIADEKDVRYGMESFVVFEDEVIKGRTIYFTNLDRYVNNSDDFFDAMMQIDDTGIFDPVWVD